MTLRFGAARGAISLLCRCRGPAANFPPPSLLPSGPLAVCVGPLRGGQLKSYAPQQLSLRARRAALPSAPGPLSPIALYTRDQKRMEPLPAARTWGLGAGRQCQRPPYGDFHVGTHHQSPLRRLRQLPFRGGGRGDSRRPRNGGRAMLGLKLVVVVVVFTLCCWGLQISLSLSLSPSQRAPTAHSPTCRLTLVRVQPAQISGELRPAAQVTEQRVLKGRVAQLLGGHFGDPVEEGGAGGGLTGPELVWLRRNLTECKRQRRRHQVRGDSSTVHLQSWPFPSSARQQQRGRRQRPLPRGPPASIHPSVKDFGRGLRKRRRGTGRQQPYTIV